jgi:glycerol uptake facilitator protein
VGGALVFAFYREHFKVTDDGSLKLACFCTSPNIRNIPQAFFCEVMGTFLLVLPVFLMTDAKINLPLESGATNATVIGLGTLGALPVALLVFAIGLSLGWNNWIRNKSRPRPGTSPGPRILAGAGQAR